MATIIEESAGASAAGRALSVVIINYIWFLLGRWRLETRPATDSPG
jgi:hypothetical protein